MQNPHLLLAPSGHFDPFTLSIYESAQDAVAWRERADHLAAPGFHRLDEFLSTVRGEKGQGVRRSDLTSSLISSHEHDHFVRHASSEIGLLLTLLHQLRYAAHIGYCRAVFGNVGEAEPYEQEIRNLNFLHEALWTYNPHITQGQAVAALNRFFLQFDVDGPVFTTSEPDKPHCPAPNFTYKNVLEASAVLGEMIRVETMKLDPSFMVDRLKGYFDYDFETYGATLHWVLDQVERYSPGAMLAVRLCLDSRVPVIGSPYTGPVDWEDFHPGYKLINFTFAAGNAVKMFNFTAKLKEAFEENPATMYLKELQEPVYRYMTEVAKSQGKLRLWDDPGVESYETSPELLLRRLSPAGQNLAEAVAPGRRCFFVMSHLFEAFNNYKKERRLNPLSFHSPLITFSPHNPPDASFQRQPNHYFVMFSIFGSTIDSFYLREDWERVVYVVQLHFMQEAMNRLLGGERLGDITDDFEKKYQFAGETLNTAFWENFRLTAAGNLLGVRG